MKTKSKIISKLIELDRATCFMSYQDEKHPLFQELLKLCRDINRLRPNHDVDILIKHLRNDVDSKDSDGYPRGVWWAIHALAILTGANPIKEENCGYLDKVIEDWLEWADNNR